MTAVAPPPPPPATILDDFAQAAALVGAATCTTDEAGLVALVRELVGSDPAVLAPDAWARVGPHPGWRELGGDPGALADIPVAVVVATAGIAETGSVVLVERDRSALLLDLWAHHLVVLVSRDRLVATLPEAGPALVAAAPEGVVTILSGPSRTADIERRLTIGVQGPRSVTVVVVG